MQVAALLSCFLGLLVIGCPIGFALMIASIVYVVMQDLPMIILVERYVGTMDSFAFLAIPFYLMAANVMNQIGVTKRIFDFALSVMGHIRGGLAQVNVLASMIFAGMSGSNTADAAGLGTIETKVMLEEKYDASFIAAVTAASAMIGPIIPPSISMVVWAGIAEVSVGRMFAAGILPGILMGLSMMTLIYVMDRFGWVNCPRRKRATAQEFVRTGKGGFLSLLAPLIIVGGILGGVVTPTEAGALATAYALLLGLYYRELTVVRFVRAVDDTAAATAFILLMIAGAHASGWVVTLEKLPEAFSALMFSITDNKILILLIVNFGLLIFGMFIEGVAALVIVAPTMLYLGAQLGIDPVHLGVFLVINMLLGLITPPVAPILYMTGAIARAPMAGVIKAVLPFFVPLVISLLAVTYIPGLSLWVPELLWGP